MAWATKPIKERAKGEAWFWGHIAMLFILPILGNLLLWIVYKQYNPTKVTADEHG